ncbi:serine proteinase inhibitor, putative [Ixodes scapularis]|uniref:Serine proteinase inhibitor, putative n=1 Tax=Ixodes scapularis TaxID=6945 RepID=B7PSX4_IXOSC|nr:serine proteinase inhibitor, putative [Ixodes scapularis]|eukprot:XP_002403239.1 serine proteinase inhibitor, putative [Ixodes scapularis]
MNGLRGFESTTGVLTTATTDDDQPLLQYPSMARQAPLQARQDLELLRGVEADNVTSTVGVATAAVPLQKEMDPRCRHLPRFSVCEKRSGRPPGFFFDGRRCTSSEALPPPQCLRGPNKFQSISHCRSSCKSQFPKPFCAEAPGLVRCSQAHVNRRWWFFLNGTCSQWDFPDGDCVSARLSAFEAAQDCHQGCLEHSHPLCGVVPVAERCSEDQFLFPAYSWRYQDGHLGCRHVDPVEPRCLQGPNNFRTQSDCRAACLAS